jgi:hypothetical protein
VDLDYATYSDLLDAFLRSDYRIATVREAATECIEPPVVILRHDVEWSARRAAVIGSIEESHGVRSTLYFRLDTPACDLRAMATLQRAGHDIGYHYNTLDRARGDLASATDSFEQELSYLRRSGIDVVSATAHGNPRLKRVGHSSNTDLVERDPSLLSRLNLLDVGLFGNEFERQPSLFTLKDSNGRWNHGAWSWQQLFESIRARSVPRLFLLVHTDYWSSSRCRTLAFHAAAFGLRRLGGNAVIAQGRFAAEAATGTIRRSVSRREKLA